MSHAYDSMPTAIRLLTGLILVATPHTLVAQSHTETVSSGSATYAISPGGSADPLNTSISIRNVGTSEVVNPTIVVNDKDWSSVDRILDSFITPDMTDEEKARAIWSFARKNRYHWYPPTKGYDANDPVKLFNVYGYGFCDNVTGAQAVFYDRLGIPYRHRHLGSHEHSVIEAYWDEAWHVLDADRDGLYLMRDNRTIAGVDDLRDDPALVARAGPAHADLVDIYRRTPNGGWDGYGAAGHTLDLTLRPAEELTLSWAPSGHYHEDTDYNAAPPIYANGRLTSPFDPSQRNMRQWLSRSQGIRLSGEDGGSPALSPTLVNSTGELIYRVSSPYPFVRTQFEGTVYRASQDDRIEVAVIPAIQSVQRNWLELSYHWYHIAGLHTEAEGLTTSFDDEVYSRPALHPTTAGSPATLTYRMRRDTLGRPKVGGLFFRESTDDMIEIAVSGDGETWNVVWRPTSRQVGYFEHDVDITSRIMRYDSFYVQFRFESRGTNWFAGMEELRLDGIEPFAYKPIWSSDDSSETGEIPLSLDFTDTLLPKGHPPVYQYLVRIRLLSPNSARQVGLEDFQLTSTVQVAPMSLPALRAGENVVTYADESRWGRGEVAITHRWEEPDHPGPPPAPPGPVSPSLDGTAPHRDRMTFTWQRAVHPEGVPVYLYDVQICDGPRCLSPLSSIFDLYVYSTHPGPDGVFGTADDGPTVDAEPTWTTPFGDWLTPGETYYWRVRARDQSLQESPWSEPWPFTVQ